MGELILTRQIDEEKNILRRRRDKDKRTDYHEKEKQRNQDKEKAIERNIGEVVSMSQIGYYNKDRKHNTHK